MVGNPEDRSSRIEAQITSMSPFHFPQIDSCFFSLNYSKSNNMSSDKVCLKRFVFTLYEHYNAFCYGYTSSACSNSAHDFSIHTTFIRL